MVILIEIILILAVLKLFDIAIWLGRKSVRWTTAIDELLYQRKKRKARESVDIKN